MRTRRLIGLIPMALAISTAIASEFSERQVNPKTYSSASGRYQLRVNPDDPDASKGGNYRLSLDGKVLWQKHLSFALLQAGITDEGRFGGYAVRGTDFKLGEVVIVIAGSKGQIILSESYKRRESQMMHGSPDPHANGLIFDAEHDRMTVRVSDPDVNEGREQWWTYLLSDGKPGLKLDPKQYMDLGTTWIADARSLPGTPLTLISWLHYDGSRSHYDGQMGAAVTLVDSTAKPVWRLDMKGDYEVGKNQAERSAALSRFQQSGSILAAANRTFDIHFAKRSQKVSFSVQPNGDSWTVTEVGCQPYSPPVKKTYPSFPQVRLRLQRRWTIPVRKPRPSPIREIRDFEVIGNKWIATLRGGDSPAVILTDLRGFHALVLSIPTKKVGYGEDHLAWLGGLRFLVSRVGMMSEDMSETWITDFSTRKVTTLKDLPKARISSVAGSPNGEFAAAISINHPNSSEDGIAMFSRTGKLLWKRESQSDDILPEDIAVDSNGRVAVLDVVRHSLHFFSKGGKYLSIIELDKAWKKEADYPTQVRCVGSGFLIWDMHVAYFLDSRGRILSAVKPRFSNSKPLDSHWDPQVDGTGRLWISNGDALYRLDKSGVVEAAIGQVGGLSGLHEIEELVIGPDDSKYAYDKTSDEVHVFSSSGNRKVVIKPLRRDLKDSDYRFGGRMAIDGLGRIYVNYGGKGLVRYSASGKREANIDPKLEDGGRLPSSWKPGWWWCGTHLLDGEGKTVTTITRLPSEDWLSWAPDQISRSVTGELAILEPGELDDKDRMVQIGFYSSTGSPQATAKLDGDPEKLWRFAYDGRLVYFPREKDLLAFDKTGKPAWRFVLPVRKGAMWQAFPSRGGVAMFDGIDMVYWYATER